MNASTLFGSQEAGCEVETCGKLKAPSPTPTLSWGGRTGGSL